MPRHVGAPRGYPAFSEGAHIHTCSRGVLPPALRLSRLPAAHTTFALAHASCKLGFGRPGLGGTYPERLLPVCCQKQKTRCQLQSVG